MLAAQSAERSKQTDAKKGGSDEAVVRKIEVVVDYSEPGWMAVSFEKDGQAYAGMMLQANREGSMPAFLNSGQLADWKTRLAREKAADTVGVDEGTSVAADRTTTTLDRSRIRSVRLRPTIGRFICAKCRTPAGSVAEQASKRKSELLASPARTGLIAKKPKLDVRRKSPHMTPIVEMRTPNGYIFRPVGMTQKQQQQQPGQPPAQRSVLHKVVVKSSPAAPNAVQNMLVRRPIVNLGAPITVSPAYRQQPQPQQQQQSGVESQRPVPKIRIVMPNRGNASTPVVATTTTTSSPVTNSPVCATGTAVIMTGAPILSHVHRSMTLMPSTPGPKPISSCPKTPPIRIKLGGMNFRQLVNASAGPQVAGGSSRPPQVIRIHPVPSASSSTSSSTVAHATISTKPRIIPQARRVIDVNLETEDSSESVESFEPSPAQNPEGLRPGEVVWAKMPGEPYWPAQIYSFNPGGEACVLWLGSTLHGFVTIHTLEPFAKCFAKRYNPKRTERGYQKAVVDAIVKNKQKTSDTTYYEQKLSSSAWKQLSGGKLPKNQMAVRRAKKGKKRKALAKAAGAAAVESSTLPSGRRAKAVPQHIQPDSAEVSSSGVEDSSIGVQPTVNDEKHLEEKEEEVEEMEKVDASCSKPTEEDDSDVSSEAPVLQAVDEHDERDEEDQEDQAEEDQPDDDRNGHSLGPMAGGIEMLESDEDEPPENSSGFDTLDTVISELQEMNEMFV